MSRETLDDDGRVTEVLETGELPAIIADVGMAGPAVAAGEPPAARPRVGDATAAAAAAVGGGAVETEIPSSRGADLTVELLPGRAGGPASDLDAVLDPALDADRAADRAAGPGAGPYPDLDVDLDPDLDVDLDPDLVADLGVSDRNRDPRTTDRIQGGRWRVPGGGRSPAGPSGRARILAATMAAVLVAVLVGVASYAEGGRSRERAELASARLIVWTNPYLPDDPYRLRSGRVLTTLYLTLTSAVPVTVLRLHLRIGDAVPASAGVLSPGRTAAVPAMLELDCSPAALQDAALQANDQAPQTATIRTSDGRIHEIPVTAAGTYFMADDLAAVCTVVSTPRVTVSSMMATREGAVLMELTSLEARPVQVTFVQNPTGGAAQWRLAVSPSNPILIPPQGHQAVVLRFGFPFCFTDHTLPDTGGLVIVEIRRTRPPNGVGPAASTQPAGWDDSVLAAAAAAAATRSCS